MHSSYLPVFSAQVLFDRMFTECRFCLLQFLNYAPEWLHVSQKDSIRM